MAINPESPAESFVSRYTECQRGLYAYILSLLHLPDATDDVLQETNLVLWRKAAEYEEGSPFMTWACAIARYQVLAYLKRQSRDRLHFDEDLVKKLADQAVSHAEQMESRRRALQGCVEKLPDNDRELIQSRYNPEGSVGQLANATGRSVGAISQALYRIRQALHSCIEKKLAIQD